MRSNDTPKFIEPTERVLPENFLKVFYKKMVAFAIEKQRGSPPVGDPLKDSSYRMVFDKWFAAFVSDPKNGVRQDKQSIASARSNLQNEIAKDRITWLMYLKTLRLQGVVKYKMTIDVQYKDGTEASFSDSLNLGGFIYRDHQETDELQRQITENLLAKAKNAQPLPPQLNLADVTKQVQGILGKIDDKRDEYQSLLSAGVPPSTDSTPHRSDSECSGS